MHRILRQIVEVDVRGSERTGLAVQRLVSELCQHAQGRQLEAALAPFDGDPRHLVVDRIEIDLGTVSMEELEAALTASLSAAVAACLREQAASAPRGVTRGTGPRSLSPAEALLAAVLHVLRHGRRPWWYAEPESGSLEARFAALLGGRGESGSGFETAALAAFVGELVAALRAERAVRERVVRQLAPATVLVLLARLDPPLHAEVVEALRRVERAAPEPARREALARGVLEAAIDVLGRAIPAGEATSWGADDLVRLAVARIAPPARAGPGSPPPGANPGVAARGPAATPSPSAEDEVAREGLLVERAGLVLLHPFLPRFLEAAGVARGGELLRPSRAMLLLHHLATGATEAEEHELLFAKLLCGRPLEEPVEREPPVTAGEQSEATALLDAAIEHWETLRGTSPDGLRGSFLVRPGRLELQQDEWVLRLQPQSWDVLLDQLPWGLAHVKLPWMSRLLRVEWAP